MYPSLAGLRASELQRKNAPTSVDEDIRYNCHGWPMRRVQYADGRGPQPPYYVPLEGYEPLFEFSKQARARIRFEIRQLLAQRKVEEATKLFDLLNDNEAPWSKCLDRFDEDKVPLFDRQDTDPSLHNEIQVASAQMRKRKEFEDKLETYSKKLKTFNIDLPQAPPLDRLYFGHPVPEIPMHDTDVDHGDDAQPRRRRVRPTPVERPDDGQPGPSVPPTPVERPDDGQPGPSVPPTLVGRPDNGQPGLSRYIARDDDDGPRPSSYIARDNYEGPRPSR